MLAQLRADLVHRAGQIDRDGLVAGHGSVGARPGERLVGDVRKVVRRLGLQLLEEDAVGGDLRDGLTVRGAGDGDGDGQRGAVAGEPDDADVMAEVLAAELRADTERAGQLVDLRLELDVAEAVPRGGVAGGGDVVEVAGAGVLRRLQGELRARAADDDGEVVRRAGRGAEGAQLLVEETHHPVRVEDGLRLLVQERLVRAASALGEEQQLVHELVLGVGVGVELDLGGEVAAGVLLVPHRHRRHLAVAQVEAGVRVVDAAGEGALVMALGEDVLPALAHDDRRARVLAHRQDPARGDVRVLQQVEGDELVVVARLGVLEDLPQLSEVARAEVVRDVVHRGLGEQAQGLGRDLEEAAAARALDDLDALGRQQAPRGLGLTVATGPREQVLVRELGHRRSPSVRATGQPTAGCAPTIDP